MLGEKRCLMSRWLLSRSIGPRSDGFYNDAERDAFMEKQTKALTEALDRSTSRIIEKASYSDDQSDTEAET